MLLIALVLAALREQSRRAGNQRDGEDGRRSNRHGTR